MGYDIPYKLSLADKMEMHLRCMCLNPYNDYNLQAGGNQVRDYFIIASTQIKFEHQRLKRYDGFRGKN